VAEADVIQQLVGGRRYVVFEVAGVPQPQGSKTIKRTKGGGAVVREDNPATEPWRNAVAAAAINAMEGGELLAGPLLLWVEFRFPRPKAHYGTGRNAGALKASAPHWCTTRPDLDKLVRAVGDAITGVVCVDDCQLVEVEAVKVYDPPGARVCVYEIGGM
jgi:crossover junction endodeoxyribonuclease RusA